MHVLAVHSASELQAVKSIEQAPSTQRLVKQSTLLVHSPDETTQRPLHTPPPPQSLERVHSFTVQPGKLLEHWAARLRHFSGTSVSRAPQQSSASAQSTWKHSLPVGAIPKVEG